MSGDTDSYFLRSERVGFRTWTAEDLPLALGLWGDPEVTRLQVCTRSACMSAHTIGGRGMSQRRRGR